jgi:hypothetical protein
MKMMIKIIIAGFETSARPKLFALSFYSCSYDWRIISGQFSCIQAFFCISLWVIFAFISSTPSSASLTVFFPRMPKYRFDYMSVTLC